MKSVAIGHFPKVVVQSNRFWLYNSVLKKRYENRPEERVRLKWVEYLLHQTGWKKSRIGFETPVKTEQNQNTLRADLVLHSEKMNPKILVECKSETVKINTKTAEQAAKYNTRIRAPYLVLTNGIEDFWYEQKDGGIIKTENIFDEYTSLFGFERNYNYWQQRGFCSNQINKELQKWLSSALQIFWNDPASENQRYLDFQETVLSVPMNHHYKIVDINHGKRLAISFIGTGQSDNYLVAILNSGGVNRAILSINLNEIQKGKKLSGVLFTNNQKKTVFSQDHLSFRFSAFESQKIENLPETLMNFFD